MKLRPADLALLGLGCGLLFFLGWEWNAAPAAWLAPLFLIRFFRTRERVAGTLWAVPLLLAVLYLGIRGRWHLLALPLELSIGLSRGVPFLVALYLDRWLAPRLPAGFATLVYPATFVLLDFALSFGPSGSVFSPAVTQLSLAPLVQLAAVTGIWGITFATGWFASTANLVWERGLDLRAAARPAGVFAAVLGAVLMLGSVRISTLPGGATVRIGSVGIDFESPYWAEIKRRNPSEGRERFAVEHARLRERLFEESLRTVRQGARIVFWAEGNGPLYKDEEPAFLERARAFAREHDIWFAPALLVLHPGEAYAENKVLMIDPDGEVRFSYEKTKTPKQTRSDGVLPVVDTPYGRLSVAICFDMDFPTFVNQLGDRDVDIVLVPSWDSAGIAPYHTDVGLLRAVENGFSLVRHVIKGASAAVDPHGQRRAYQDFFSADHPTMISDVPVRGVRTVYGALGDWFVYACGVGVLGLAVQGLRRHA